MNDPPNFFTLLSFLFFPFFHLYIYIVYIYYIYSCFFSTSTYIRSVCFFRAAASYPTRFFLPVTAVRTSFCLVPQLLNSISWESAMRGSLLARNSLAG